MGIALKYQIKEMTNVHPDFYRLIGPFLARRAIVKELGGSIWDDDGKIWFIAFVQDKAIVAGFATMLSKSSVIIFDDAYVLPQYRENGIHARLIDERLAHCSVGLTVHVVVNASSMKQYKSRGFTVKRQRGKAFTEMVKVIADE